MLFFHSSSLPLSSLSIFKHSSISHYQIKKRHSRKIKYSEWLNKRKETLITRMRLGKCWLNFYLKTQNKLPSEKCDTFGCDETGEHFPTECAEQQLMNKLENICRQSAIKATYQLACLRQPRTDTENYWRVNLLTYLKIQDFSNYRLVFWTQWL